MESVVLDPAIPNLPSGNINKTEEFFVKKLGFETIANLKEYHYLIIKRGPAEIHFWECQSEEEAKKLGSASSCYIRVKNIQKLFEEFKGNGAVFRYEPTVQPWGLNEMQIDDPYGNAIRFGELLKTHKFFQRS